MAWKAHLVDRGYAAATVNAILTSLNQFFSFQGWPECRVRILRVQRRLFRDSGSELTRPEYDRLVDAAQAAGKERLALLMETICSTGIRVSEVQYITVQAAYRGRAEVSLKGKIRVIMLPGRLCRKLLKYAKKQKIVSGEIFLTRNKTSLSRRQIWAELKHLCRYAGVEPAKVFPHNLRHLFAVIFYRACKDISRLAADLSCDIRNRTRPPAGTAQIGVIGQIQYFAYTIFCFLNRNTGVKCQKHPKGCFWFCLMGMQSKATK